MYGSVNNVFLHFRIQKSAMPEDVVHRDDMLDVQAVQAVPEFMTSLLQILHYLNYSI